MVTRRTVNAGLLAMLGGAVRVGFAADTSSDSARVSNGTDWHQLQETDLEVPADTSLDFSKLRENGPAGQYGWAVRTPDGHIAFERRPTPQRFFCASFQFAPSNGGMPDRGEARRIVAQLARTGYNAVRLQCVDAQLMTGRHQDFDFDPEQFDRFLFLLAQLKEQGIYVVMDVMYLDNGGYGGIFPHRWIKRYDLRRDLYLEEAAREHWRRLLTAMLGTRNPHTGTVPLQDPGLLMLVLSNEGGIVELSFREGGGWNARVPDVYAEAFRTWLLKEYQTDAKWRSVWGSEARGDESLEGRVAVPARWRTQGPRQRDFMRFVSATERATVEWMQRTVADTGYRGLTTAFNNWNWLATDISRSASPVVDMHAYHAHPTAFVSPGSTVSQESSLPKAAAYVRELASARQWGRPFTVTEYGHAFWNRYRREAGALVPAIASLQSWDLIAQFSENSLQLSYAPPQPSRRAAIFPFTISTDPIRRATERLAALLYMRGDVAPAKNSIEYRIDAQGALKANGGWSQLSETASRMALVSAIGIAWFDAPAASKRISLEGADDFLVDKSQIAYKVFAPSGSPLRRALSQKGAMSDRHWDDVDRERFISDTGELELDARGASFTVKTRRTVVYTGPGPNAVVGPLTISELAPSALVALASLTNSSITDSDQLLLFVLSDATNTGIEFADGRGARLHKLGGLPIRLQRVQVALRIATSQAQRLRLYALSQSGRRVEEVPLVRQSDNVQVRIDTGLLAKGPSTIFELSVPR